MASAEQRAMAMSAAALLPGLLPTPPRSTMLTPCIVILPPAASNPKHPKPGRADSDERWDAHKNSKPRSPASSSCGSTSPGLADSCLRGDINKKKKVIPDSSSASSSSMSISGDSRASSGDRWDAHKKPARDAVISDAESRTGDQAQAQQMSEDKEEEEETMLMEMEETAAAACFVDRRVLFSGPSFFVTSPEPSMLPMPTFVLSRHAAGKIIPDLPSMSILQLH